MLAQNNDYFKEASETIYHLTQEEEIRLQCEAREDYYRTMNGLTDMLDKQKQALAEKDSLLSQKDSLLAEKDALIATLQAQLAAKE